MLPFHDAPSWQGVNDFVVVVMLGAWGEACQFCVSSSIGWIWPHKDLEEGDNVQAMLI